jgi:hypothetical protein
LAGTQRPAQSRRWRRSRASASGWPRPRRPRRVTRMARAPAPAASPPVARSSSACITRPPRGHGQYGRARRRISRALVGWWAGRIGWVFWVW